MGTDDKTPRAHRCWLRRLTRTLNSRSIRAWKKVYFEISDYPTRCSSTTHRCVMVTAGSDQPEGLGAVARGHQHCAGGSRVLQTSSVVQAVSARAASARLVVPRSAASRNEPAAASDHDRRHAGLEASARPAAVIALRPARRHR